MDLLANLGESGGTGLGLCGGFGDGDFVPGIRRFQSLERGKILVVDLFCRGELLGLDSDGALLRGNRRTEMADITECGDEREYSQRISGELEVAENEREERHQIAPADRFRRRPTIAAVAPITTSTPAATASHFTSKPRL